jgi:hypothetical protein
VEPQELTAADKPRGIAIELVGAPAHVLAAFQQNASNDPEAVEAAKQRLEKRDGAPYSYDPETKLFERLPAVVHVPKRREPVAPTETGATRPRERRARSRSTAPTRGSPDDSGDLPQRLSADERRALKAKVDARRREVVKASERAERSLELAWRRATA